MKCFLFSVLCAVVFFFGGLFASQLDSVRKCPFLNRLVKFESGGCSTTGACKCKSLELTADPVPAPKPPEVCPSCPGKKHQ